MGDRVEKPTSYHPEQLIGKVIRIKDSFEKITGHFAADDVIFDDAIELVRSKTSHYQEARRYICKALDMIGRNEVSKKAVNIPDEEALRYSPKCSMILFFQPFSIPEESSLQGLFRRFPIIYLGFEEKDSSSKFEERLEDGPEQNPQADFGRYLFWK